MDVNYTVPFTLVKTNFAMTHDEPASPDPGEADKPAGGRAGKPAAIVAAAKRLFLGQGYGATSMDAVAREAPVSKRTLYNHFPSKEALFTAVVKDAYASLAEVFGDAAPIADAAEALRAYVARLEEHWRHPDVQPLLRLIIAEAPTTPGLSQSYLTAGKGPAVLELIRLFEGAPDRHGMSAERRASQFMGMIKDALFWPDVLGVPPAQDREAVIEDAIRRVLG